MNRGLPPLIPLLVTGAIAGALLRVNKRSMNGLWVWEQREILKIGIRGTATVLQKIARSNGPSTSDVSFSKVEAVVEISLPDRAPYRTTILREIMTINGELDVGEVLPVVVDPGEQNRVVVDIAAIKAGKRAKRDAKGIADPGSRPGVCPSAHAGPPAE